MKTLGKHLLPALGGLAVGIINGLLGAGGGMLAVPLLKRQGGLEQKKAHASAIAVILPLTLISASLYLFTKKVTFHAALPYLPAGFFGALFGIWLLPRIPDKVLRKMFAAFMIWAGVRMLWN